MSWIYLYVKYPNECHFVMMSSKGWILHIFVIANGKDFILLFFVSIPLIANKKLNALKFNDNGQRLN